MMESLLQSVRLKNVNHLNFVNDNKRGGNESSFQ